LPSVAPLKTRRRATLIGLLAAAMPICAAAQAHSYPARSVRIIVPSSPGGSLDLVARIVGDKLGQLWKQTVIVDNRPGASFIIGTSAAAKAPADGYTLLFAHDGPMAMNAVLYAKLPYDPVRDFTPVSQVVYLPMVLYVNKSVGASSVNELVAAFKSKPGGLNHASGGTASYMTSELFKSMAQVDYTDVPYKGAAPAVQSTAAGETQLTFADPPSGTASVQAGYIRPIAVSSPRRLRLFPNLPTIAESIPGYSAASWSGLHAPAGTPAMVVAKINADVRNVLAMSDVRTRLESLGVEPNPSTPDELAALIKRDIDKWGRLVKERNIKVEQ
jgi:tripartite-type tricarboxylate transporter receptor subunit TctC